jgi:hypothetical protein
MRVTKTEYSLSDMKTRHSTAKQFQGNNFSRNNVNR